MKTTTSRRSGPRTTKLAPPRIRLTPSRLPRLTRGLRKHSAIVAPAEPQVPAPVAKEPTHASMELDGVSDALHLYFREIGQVRLLTPEEEVVLAKRIRRGDAKAREQMIKANLRLVVKIARDYEGLGLPLLDLINEGNVGLMKGVERFDPTKGAKLSTYASWWIRQSIKRALANQSKTIRLPVHVVDKVANIHRAERRLREALGREPSEDEVASELEMSPQQVRRYLEASRATLSLDAPLSADGDDPVAEVVADPNAHAPYARMLQANDSEMVQEALASLGPRERTILSMRFGLENDTPMTLEEVGSHFAVTRERIRQIQEQALRELRVRLERRERPNVATAAA